MRYLYLLLLLTFLLWSSCKKEKDEDTSPLQTLVPVTADNYCVLALTNGDTVVWQNTKGIGSTPFTDTVTVGNTLYQRAESVYGPPTLNAQFILFELEFRTAISGPSTAGQCSLLDKMIYTGNIPVNSTNAVVALVNYSGYGTNTVYTANLPTPDGPPKVEVVNIIKIAESSGCNTFRVKAILSNLQFGALGCKVPAYTIKEGLVQMDFTIN